MRRFIYKAELELLFSRYEVEEKESDRIKSRLFKNPYSSISRQYQLNNEIGSISEIQTVLKEGNSEYFIGAVIDIFTINEDLQIDESLKKLLLGDEKVAIFIGAGVSKLGGYPLWGELANKAINYLWKEKSISFAEKEKLIAEISDPKQLLSIFDKFCSRNDEKGRKFYEDIFLEKEEDYVTHNPYDQLVSPYFDWLKVTSNIDFSLAKALLRNSKMLEEESPASTSQSKTETERESFYDNNIVSKNFPTSNLNPDKLYYLHGRIDDIENSIFTTEDYIKNYFSDESETKVKPFLEHLFQNYNVIFIGYGLGELPILEAVMKKSEKSHFALMEAKYHERNVLQIKEHYYKQLGIKPIPYYTDHDGYDRLTKVLSKWKDEIKAEREKSSASFLEERNTLDEVVK